MSARMPEPDPVLTAPETTLPAPVPTTTTTVPEPGYDDRPGRMGSPPPEWLGEITLEERLAAGSEVPLETPPALVDRQLWSIEYLPPPEDDTFVSLIESPAPAEVIARSTWNEECPVDAADLSYAQVSFYGFDGLYHTGELLLHRDFTRDVVDIFAALHEIQFPIEELRVTSPQDMTLDPTGDSNNTSGFECRRTVSSQRWSRHAFGTAIDINPFHNPYVKGDLVIPPLATAYLDRDRDVPGMITPEIEALFADLGWGWGGDWNSSTDWMHFSDTGD